MFGIKEHSSPKYPPRTALNVKEADATIRIATNFFSPGEKLTLKLIQQYKKPHRDINNLFEPKELARWLIEKNVGILNVAGNSERTSPGIYAFAYKFLTETFQIMKDQDGSLNQ